MILSSFFSSSTSLLAVLVHSALASLGASILQAQDEDANLVPSDRVLHQDSKYNGDIKDYSITD